jgi:hypothetical protein
MSLATLKRKTQAKYNNMSVGSKTGFSLNGTHRSQGYVGQTSLSRSLPRTLMKGNVIKGHGGCCGKYPVYDIIQSGVTSLNDPKIVKPSVMNTNGMIHTQYRWIWRPQPYSSTKQDSHRTQNPQSEYISSLSANTAARIDISYSIIDETAKTTCNSCLTLPREALPKRNNSAQLVQTRNPGNVTKTNFTRPENNNPLLGIGGGNYLNSVYTQDEYILKLNSQCTKDSAENIEISSNCANKPMKMTITRIPLIGGSRSY